jgi:hypothetical protein
VNTPALRNATASTIIPTNAVVRLVFGETYSVLNDDVFAGKFADVWNQLPYKAQLFPVTAAGTYAGQTAVSIDARNNARRSMGELVAAAQALTGSFVELRSAELLTSEAAKQVLTPEGAKARDDAASKAAAQKNADDPISKFFHGLGDVAQKVFIVVIIVGVCVALAYAGKIRKELS